MTTSNIKTNDNCDERFGSNLLYEPAGRLDVPRQGYVLSKAAERVGVPVRHAVRALESSLAENPLLPEVWRQHYQCRKLEPASLTYRAESELAAWFVVSTWLLGVSTREIPSGATLHEAEEWMLGSVSDCKLCGLIGTTAVEEAESLLHKVGDVGVLLDLLPYILDPHGEGSRLSVRVRPETSDARLKKKEDGVFYTPGDLAQYMAAETLRDLGDAAIPVTVFDPACGTGVFLRVTLFELLRKNENLDPFDLACSSLYGVDTDPWAVNASAFVLLSVCLHAVGVRGIAPFAAWHAIRLNLSQVDALRLDHGRQIAAHDAHRVSRLKCRAQLKSGVVPPVFGDRPVPGPIPFSDLFPEIAEGPRIVIGNPPYAAIGPDADLNSLSKRFDTAKAAPKPTADMYPLFVEQMIRLTAPNAHGGAMVVPLSLACNTGSQFLSLRTLIALTPGHWRFAFFDREPHALFGEDVKTRNAVVIWTRHGTDSSVQVSTGPLRKWRGTDRARMFQSIEFTPTRADIRPGIPKIDGEHQDRALDHLLRESRTLEREVTHLGRATLKDAMTGNDTTVYVASTAYNFLSVFLKPPEHDLTPLTALTENPLHAIECSSRRSALRTFALLSSGLAFWWWHIHGDGFHVARHVIQRMPVGQSIRGAPDDDPLDEIAESMWKHVSSNPVISLNRGRTSLGYSAVSSKLRNRVDFLYAQWLGLDDNFLCQLQRYIDCVVNARLPQDLYEFH